MEKRANSISIGKWPTELGRTLWNFQYPHQVVSDLSLGLDEKRAILAAWASDAHAVESFPTLRHLPGTPFPVTLSSIMDARLRLDNSTDIRLDLSVPPPGRTEHYVPRSIPKSRTIQNTLLVALDRKGRLQTARWGDFKPVADNRDGMKDFSKGMRTKTSHSQLTKSAEMQTYSGLWPGEESLDHLRS